MACCSCTLLTFIKSLAFILPSWASEKQPIKVVLGQKSSSPIQKQGSRKNYPWVSLEVFNRFSSHRREGVWEMPAYRAGRSPGHGKGSFRSSPPRSQHPSARISFPAFHPGHFWAAPTLLAGFGAGDLLAQRPRLFCRCKNLPLVFQEMWGVPQPGDKKEKNHNWSWPPQEGLSPGCLSWKSVNSLFDNSLLLEKEG